MQRWPINHGGISDYTQLPSVRQVPKQYHGTAKMPMSRNMQKSQVPIRRTHKYSILRGAAHLSSVVIAGAILTLCFRNVYFDDITRPNINSMLNAFQFAARLHEFIVGGSLTGIVAYHLLNLLCLGDGLPLGYVASAFQFSQPQTLWSREFWVASLSSSQPKSKYWFGILVILATSIIGLIGPSSAILIIPQLDWWPVNDPFSGPSGFSWINSSYEALWPATVNRSLITDPCDILVVGTDRACPWTNMRDIQNWVSDYAKQSSPPNFTVTADSGMLNYLTASDGGQRRNGYSVGATGVSFLTRSLGTIWSYGQENYFAYSKAGRPLITLTSDNDRPILKPLVQVQCAPPQDITTRDEVVVSFNASALVMKEHRNTGNISLTVNATDYRSDDKHIRFNFVDISVDSTPVTLGALLGASFARPEEALHWQIFPSVNGTDVRALFACMIKAAWVPTTMSRDPQTDNIATVDNPDPYEIVKNEELMGKARELDIDLSFANYLNAPLQGLDFTNVIESEFSRFSYAPPFFDGTANETWPWLLSTVLSLQLTDSLARISHDTAHYLWHQSSHNPSDIYAKDLECLKCNGGQSPLQNLSRDFPEQIRANRTMYYPVRWEFKRYGYAWSFAHDTKILAFIVLLAHILLIIIHLGIVWAKKQRFGCWEQQAEFLTLAMQSPPSAPLTGTSVGIKDSRVFADPVYIRESEEGDSAALVMDKQSKSGMRKRLGVGKKYI